MKNTVFVTTWIMLKELMRVIALLVMNLFYLNFKWNELLVNTMQHWG